MSFWNRNPHGDLERRLRAERPQATDEVVRRLSGEVPGRTPAPRPRRSVVPRAAVVLLVTAAITGALGVAGAIGYATKSVNTFGSNVQHVFTSSHTSSFGTNDKDNKGEKGNQGNDGDPGDDDGNPFHDPFHHVYGIQLPICKPDGTLTTVRLGEYIFFILFFHYYPASTNDGGKTFFCGPPPSR